MKNKQIWSWPQLIALTLGCVLLIAIGAMLTGCAATRQYVKDNPIELQARDAIAAAKGFIEQQQSDRQAECQANPLKTICVAINKGVAAQNLLIDALEVYCASPQFAMGNAPCVPNKELEPKLQEAMRNLRDAIDQVKVIAGQNTGVLKADVAGIGFLGLLSMVLSILSPLLTSLKSNPLYGSIALSLEKAIEELTKARDEVLTRDELESLRTRPKW